MRTAFGLVLTWTTLGPTLGLASEKAVTMPFN